jgi:hypothetical protein
MDYMTCVIFKTQINYMNFFKQLKLNEILCVTTFNIICIFNFEKNYLHIIMHLPQTIVQ